MAYSNKQKENRNRLQAAHILELSHTHIKITVIVKEKMGQNGKCYQKTKIHKKEVNGIPQLKNAIIEIKKLTKDSLKSRFDPVEERISQMESSTENI